MKSLYILASTLHITSSAAFETVLIEGFVITKTIQPRSFIVLVNLDSDTLKAIGTYVYIVSN